MAGKKQIHNPMRKAAPRKMNPAISPRIKSVQAADEKAAAKTGWNNLAQTVPREDDERMVMCAGMPNASSPAPRPARGHACKRPPNSHANGMWSSERQCARNSRQAFSTAANCVLDAGEVFMRPDDPSSATAATRRADCNCDGPPPSAGAHVRRHCGHLSSAPPSWRLSSPVGTEGSPLPAECRYASFVLRAKQRERH
jgi:hypothetical protein